MVKNLNKNRGMEEKDVDTIVDKKNKKKKSKLTVIENDEDLRPLNKKKHKRKKSDDNEIEHEKEAKTARIATEDDEKEKIDEGDKNDAQKPKTLSKTQIKKAKAEQREIDKKERSKREAKTKALQYISMWKHSKSDWKFAKIRQIWLMDNLLDESTVPDSIFPTVLEYFEGCKGMARETLLKKGMDVIKKHEQKLEESEDIVETVELIRARQLLQALPTET